MAFTDPDPLEQQMGVLCEDMAPKNLLDYVVQYHRAFGTRLAVDGPPEISVFRCMQRVYGKRDAGLIVKWVFYNHRGQWRGEKVTPLSFSKGRRWWVDRMHVEMQEELRRCDRRGHGDGDGGGLGVRNLASL